MKHSRPEFHPAPRPTSFGCKHHQHVSPGCSNDRGRSCVMPKAFTSISSPVTQSTSSSALLYVTESPTAPTPVVKHSLGAPFRLNRNPSLQPSSPSSLACRSTRRPAVRPNNTRSWKNSAALSPDLPSRTHGCPPTRGDKSSIDSNSPFATAQRTSCSIRSTSLESAPDLTNS